MKQRYAFIFLVLIFASTLSVAQVTVKFQKPDSWTAVSLYTWDAELLGGWPGASLTETDGWYTYTFDATFTAANLIFNNGGAGEQTVDYRATTDVCLKASTKTGTKYDITVVPCTAPGITVKFKKPAGWTEVRLYTYGPETTGGWPGAALTETNGWFTYTFDVSFTGANLIFNNGAAEQTEDYAITTDVCLEAASVLNANSKYDVTVVDCNPPVGMTVKFKKPTNWSAVSLYTYGPEVTGGWPGAVLTETNGWYTYTFNATFTGANLIFNNAGAGEQTEDYAITADVCLQASSTLNANSKYDVSSVECNPITYFTIKFQKPESWTAVSLYTWGPEAVGGWPGAALTETDGWYTYSMNASYTGAKLIFNNAGAGEQTADFVCVADVCLAPTGEKDGSNHYIVAPVPCTSGGITLTFQKPESWTNVNLYAYVNGNSIVGAWPGVALTQVNGVYSYTFDAKYTSVVIIYNNGTVQLPDTEVTSSTCYTSDGTSLTPVGCATITGISSMKENSFSMFPNPIVDKLNFNASVNIERISIYSINGEKVMAGEQLSKNGVLNVKSLKPGVYFVSVIFANGKQQSAKIIKR